MSGSIETFSMEKSNIEHWLFTIAEAFWPALKEMKDQRKLIGVGEVLAFVYSAP
jgi:hypothetical protein